MSCVHGDAGYSFEFMTFDGETIVVVSLTKDQVRTVGPGEMTHSHALETRA